MKSWLRVISLIVIMSLLMGTASFSVRAAPSEIKPQQTMRIDSSAILCYAMDIVFLIDQSGSMSGQNSNGQPSSVANDPNGMRFKATRYALNWLANNRLGLCAQAAHRIGVISFGSKADIELNLKDTVIEPGNQIDWDSMRTDLELRIKDRRLDTTDPGLAFTEAKKMLDIAGDYGTLPRKRALILLTDGQPCVQGYGCSLGEDDLVNKYYMDTLKKQIKDNFPFSNALKNQDQAMQAAAQQYNGFGEIPDEIRDQILLENPVTQDDLAKSIYIFFVAMNSQTPYLKLIENNFKEIAADHGGWMVDLKKNELEIPKEFNKILSWLARLQVTITGCGNLAVDPYLAGAVLDVYKVAEGLDVTIKFDGKTLKRGQGDLDFFGVVQYSEFGAVEHYRFSKPPAGLWVIDASPSICENVEAAFISFKSQVKQTKPIGILPQYNLNGKKSDPQFPYFIGYKINDRTNPDLTLDQDPRYPLNMNAVITDPKGGQSTLPMVFSRLGEWLSKDPVPVNVEGTYKIEMVAKAPCINDPSRPRRCPNPYFVVVYDNSGSYQVAPVNLFKIKLLQPVEGSILPLHGNFLPDGLALKPVNVKIQLVTVDDKPLSYKQALIGDINKAFAATLKAGKNNEKKSEMYLIPDPQDNSKFFVAFKIPSELGKNILTINLPEQFYDRAKFRPYNPEIIVEFTRKDEWYQNPDIVYVFGGGLLLVLLAFIAYIIYLKTNTVKGTLIFTKAGASSQPIGLTRGWRTTTIAMSGPQKKTLGVHKITARNKQSSGDVQYIHVDMEYNNISTAQAIGTTPSSPAKKSSGKMQTASSDLGDTKKPGGASSMSVNSWAVTYEWDGTPQKKSNQPKQRTQPLNKAGGSSLRKFKP